MEEAAPAQPGGAKPPAHWPEGLQWPVPPPSPEAELFLANPEKDESVPPSSDDVDGPSAEEPGADPAHAGLSAPRPPTEPRDDDATCLARLDGVNVPPSSDE